MLKEGQKRAKDTLHYNRRYHTQHLKTLDPGQDVLIKDLGTKEAIIGGPTTP